MINTKRALLFLPLYLAWVIAVDLLFDSASTASSTSVPMWMVVGFIVSAFAVAGVILWYLIKRASGQISIQREHTYTALLVAIVVSGFVSDALKGLATLLLGGHPWWVLIPAYTIGYAVCWVVLDYTATALRRRAQSAAGKLKRETTAR